jgi:hypothetical protein
MIYLEKRLPSNFSENPLLAEFMDVYYKYASERNNALGIVNYTSENRDVDTALDNYLDNFYSTYANHLKNPNALDKKTLIKFLNAIYSAKGSARALSVIFQIMFGEEIDITYPSENILKASDGVWVQERFITTTTLFGTFLLTDTIEFNNQFGYFTITPIRTEQISGGLTRIYFKSFEKIEVIDDQEVFVYSADRIITFAGRIVKSTDKLLVKIPGEAWQPGQVILIPGTVKDTVARVTAVTVAGGISSAEIIEYGYVHSPGQITTISPYPNKPNNSEISIDSVLVSINPDVYSHTINIVDYIDDVYESISGTDNLGASLISYLSSADKTYTEVNDNLTIVEWLASRAVLVFTENNVVTTRGYYEDSRGQISNSQMRLQDNYYYQVYSYSVETNRDIKEYDEVLKITHPAGLKMFSKLSKQSYFTVQTDVSRTLSNDLIYLLDIANLSDGVLIKEFTKPLDLIVYGTDALNNLTVTKILPGETITIIDGTTLLTLTKRITDSVTASNLDISGVTTENLTSEMYDSEVYFSETYAAIPKAITLTIQ